MSLAHVSTRAHTTPKRSIFSARLMTAAAVAIAALSGAVALPVTASAAVVTHHSSATTRHHSAKHGKRSKRAHHETAAERFRAKADKVIAEAKKQKGKPYVYGADGPHSFDCSGLVRYVFLHALHHSLPHNAAEQYRVSHHISRKQLRVGDLIFVDNGGSVSHVGIFAGHHHWWVAPHTGERVHRQRIYQAHFVYGQVIHVS